MRCRFPALTQRLEHRFDGDIVSPAGQPAEIKRPGEDLGEFGGWIFETALPVQTRQRAQWFSVIEDVDQPLHLGKGTFGRLETLIDRKADQSEVHNCAHEVAPSMVRSRLERNLPAPQGCDAHPGSQAGDGDQFQKSPACQRIC